MDIPIYLAIGLLASGCVLNQNGRKVPANKPAIKKINDTYEQIGCGPQTSSPIKHNINIVPFYFHANNETNIKRIKNPNYDSNLLKMQIENLPIEFSKIVSTATSTSNHPQKQADISDWKNQGPEGLYADSNLNNTWSELVNRPETDRDPNNRENSQIPLTHNNMVPYFGGSIRQNMTVDNRLTMGKLENFTGQFKLNKQHKTEVNPLFAPTQQDMTPLTAPRELDRYINNLQYRNNELPFEQIHVGKGLDNGFTAQPSGGFHNQLRILPKTIDKLLVNPKTVNEGRIIKGKHTISKRTAMQPQFKYKPELLVTNFNGERNFTTVGAFTKPTSRAKTIMTPTNRQNSRNVIGIAHDHNAIKHTPNQLRAKSKISSKINYNNTPFRNPVQAEGKKHHNDYHASFENRKNERSLTQVKYGQKGHAFINRKFNVTQIQSQLNDKAKNTRKQQYIMAKNPAGYLNATATKGLVYDPNSAMKPTIRQTTEVNTHNGHIANVTKNQLYNPQSEMKTTHRETTQSNSHNGQIVGSIKGPTYDPNSKSKTTIRETTENNSHQGQINNVTKNQLYNPNMTMKTTTRETTENNTHQGQMTIGTHKGLAYNPHSEMKTTIRETTENNTNNGQIKANLHKGQVYNPQSEMKTTIRETTEINSHNGQMGGSNKGIVYDPAQKTKTTIRETTENNTNNGQINNATKGRAYDPFDQAKTTIRETTENNNNNGQITNVTRNQLYNPHSELKTTLRETTENNSQIGQIKGSIKGTTYNPHSEMKTTIRESTEINVHKGQLTGSNRGITYDPNQKVKTTLRETTESNTHTGQINSLNKGRVYNLIDHAKTTTKETTENNSYQGQINTQSNNKGHVYDPNQTAKTTVRETTENNSHQGQIHDQSMNKGHVYDPNQIAKTTIRETTEKKDHLGPIGHSFKTKQIVYDPNQVAKTTIRETTERGDHIGVVSHPAQTKTIVYDPNQIAKTTIRETTEKGDYIGVVSHAVKTKQTVYDPFDFAKPTQRETTEDGDHFMPAGSTNIQNGLGYQTAPTDVKNTSRQFLTDYYYVKPAGQADAPSNQQLYDSAYNMRQNTYKEVVAEGRAPTLSGVKVTAGSDNINIDIKKLDQDRVNQYSNMPSPTFPNGQVPLTLDQINSFKNNIPTYNSYFDPSIHASTINLNPLTKPFTQ